jgi:hypothetical protein
VFTSVGLSLVSAFACAMMLVTYGSIATEHGWPAGRLFRAPPKPLALVGWAIAAAALGASIWTGPWWRVLVTLVLGMIICSVAIPLLRAVIQPLVLLGLPVSVAWAALSLGILQSPASAKHAGQRWPPAQKSAYVDRCASEFSSQGHPPADARRSCQCLADSLEAEFGITEYQAMMAAQRNPAGSAVERRLNRVMTICIH